MFGSRSRRPQRPPAFSRTDSNQVRFADRGGRCGRPSPRRPGTPGRRHRSRGEKVARPARAPGYGRNDWFSPCTGPTDSQTAAKHDSLNCPRNDSSFSRAARSPCSTTTSRPSAHTLVSTSRSLKKPCSSPPSSASSPATPGSRSSPNHCTTDDETRRQDTATAVTAAGLWGRSSPSRSRVGQTPPGGTWRRPSRGESRHWHPRSTPGRQESSRAPFPDFVTWVTLT